MILYFSGTGNSEFVAKRIAGETGDEMINLFEKIRTGDYSRIKSRTPFVFVADSSYCQKLDKSYKVRRESQGLFCYDLRGQHWKRRGVY